MTKMTKRRTPRRTTDIPNLLRLSRIHDYFQANVGCTQKQVIIFLDETKAMVEKYSAIRTECLSVISSVIDVRYGCMRQDSDNHTKYIVYDVVI